MYHRQCCDGAIGMNGEAINDLDLLVSHVDADKLKLLWSGKKRQDYIPENVRLFRSNFGRFDFGEIDVEVMGELEVFNDDRWLSVTVMQAIEISFGGIKLKIPTLEEQRRIFLLFGRPKDICKAKIIEDFLA